MMVFTRVSGTSQSEAGKEHPERSLIVSFLSPDVGGFILGFIVPALYILHVDSVFTWRPLGIVALLFAGAVSTATWALVGVGALKGSDGVAFSAPVVQLLVWHLLRIVFVRRYGREPVNLIADFRDNPVRTEDRAVTAAYFVLSIAIGLTMVI